MKCPLVSKEITATAETSGCLPVAHKHVTDVFLDYVTEIGSKLYLKIRKNNRTKLFCLMNHSTVVAADSEEHMRADIWKM